MVNPKEAEALAQQAMQDYVNKCGCDTNEDVANVLMKLASMCGLGMCAVVGKSEAVSRMQGTTDHVASDKRNASWKQETVQ